MRDVFGVTELERVHEDADGHHVAFRPGPGQQRDVPVVQCPHGGHETDRSGPRRGPGPAGHGNRPRTRRPPRSLSYTAAGSAGAVAFEAVASEAVASEAVTSEAVTSEKVASEAAAPEELVSAWARRVASAAPAW